MLALRNRKPVKHYFQDLVQANTLDYESLSPFQLQVPLEVFSKEWTKRGCPTTEDEGSFYGFSNQEEIRGFWIGTDLVPFVGSPAPRAPNIMFIM